MKRNCLYLLPNRDGSAFKIGVSCNTDVRTRALPVSIDRDRSLEIPMAGGNPYKVERMLHYYFREQQQQMPQGDGYTEWFEIAAWDDVLAFLDEHCLRLGIGAPQPLPDRPRLPRPTKDDSERQLRRQLRREAAAREAEERRREAIVHNSKTVERLGKFLDELDTQQAILGLLLAEDDHGSPRGYLYITGNSEQLESWTAVVPALSLLAEGPGFSGLMIIFPGLFLTSTSTEEQAIAEIEVSGELLSPVPLTETQYPYRSSTETSVVWSEAVPDADAVQDLLTRRVVTGSTVKSRLSQVHATMGQEKRRFRREVSSKGGPLGIWC